MSNANALPIIKQAQPQPVGSVGSAPTPPEHNGPSNKRWYGTRYDKNLTAKQIAAIVRKEIHQEIKSGFLPAGLKVSVRLRHRHAINISITAWPGNPISPAWALRHARDGLRACTTSPYTPQASAVLAHLRAKAEAFNFDGSNIISDYCDVKFFLSVDFDYELTGPGQEEAAAAWAQAETDAGKIGCFEDKRPWPHELVAMGQAELTATTAAGSVVKLTFTPKGSKTELTKRGPDLPTGPGLQMNLSATDRFSNFLPELQAHTEGRAEQVSLGVKTWAGAPYPEGFQPSAKGTPPGFRQPKKSGPGFRPGPGFQRRRFPCTRSRPGRVGSG